MVWHGFLGKAAPYVLTFAAYEALHRVVAKAPWREATVSAMACGVRGVRKAEEKTERARLTAADMFAEAIERSGESPAVSGGERGSSAPAAADGQDQDL